jgi:hypothetical protein
VYDGRLTRHPVGATCDNPAVALYTSTFDSHTATATLDVLREFAVGRDWTIVHELYDLAPPEVPRHRRIGWRTVERAVASGEVVGIVAPAEREIAWNEGDRNVLRRWLLERSAFAVYPMAGHSGSGPSAPGRVVVS